MKVRILYLQDGGEEGLVVDTQNLTNDQIEEQYGIALKGYIEIHGDVSEWPTDRLMVPE